MEHKKEETKKQREGRECICTSVNRVASSLSSKTFALIQVCANLWQVQIEFGKREIDSQASVASVVSIVCRE